MSDNGKTKITHIGQLAPRTEDYTIVNASNGDEFVVTLRDLLPNERAELNARVRYPKQKEVGFKPGGIPIYDENDPDYLKKLSEANNEYIYLWLLATWVVEYPPDADTPEKKLAILKDPTQGIPLWAFGELATRLREINGLKMSDVALEKKLLKQTPSGNSNTVPANGAVGQ